MRRDVSPTRMPAGLDRALASLRDSAVGRTVPQTGSAARLTGLGAAAMAFLAVFALAFSLATGRLAARWSVALAETATLQVAPADVARVETILGQTPGIADARELTSEETERLLAPWLGRDLPLDALPVPTLFDITESADGLDVEGLRLRLAAEVPGAVLDDHGRWRAPLAAAAGRLRGLGVVAGLLIAGATAAILTLAADASLSANGQVIDVLRLVGARDVTIASAFVRRFTRRAAAGALAGTLLGMAALAAIPGAAEPPGFLAGLGLSGAGWLWPLGIPPLVGLLAFVAVRRTALRTLRRTA